MIIDEEYWPDLDVTAAWEVLKDAAVPLNKTFLEIGRRYGRAFQQIGKAMQMLEEPKQDDYVLVPTPLPWSDPASNPLEDILSYGPMGRTNAITRDPALEEALANFNEAFTKTPKSPCEPPKYGLDNLPPLPKFNSRPNGPYHDPFRHRGMHR